SLVVFVLLPAVLAALAPLGYREILKELRPAFVLALVTTLSVVALPFVQKAAERVAVLAGGPEGEERADIIQASLSVSYVLAQLGNYFLYPLMPSPPLLLQLLLSTQGAPAGGRAGAPAVLESAVRVRLADGYRRRGGLPGELAALAVRCAGSLPRDLDGNALRASGAIGNGLCLRYHPRSPGLF